MNDRSTVNRIVTMLGAIALTGLIGLIVLVALDKSAASVAVIGTITGGAAGSLGTLLASTRSVDADQVRRDAETDLHNGLRELADAQPPVAPPPAGG